VVPARDPPANRRVKHVDVLIGAKIRERRLELGLSQEKLGGLLGITFQQVQKYERGANRVGASRMVDVAHALGVPPSYFFDTLPAATETKEAQLERELITDFRSLSNDALRQAALQIVRSLLKAVK